MKLGIIQGWDEAGFRYAAEKGLDGVEYCVNGYIDAAGFASQVPQIRALSAQYGVAVGSMGRWGMVRIDDDGNPIPQAMQDDKTLIDAASALSCPVYNVGCNRAKNLSFAENCEAAVRYFGELLAYAEGKGVKIAVFNCEWDNFVVSPNEWQFVLSKLPSLGIKYDTSHCIGRGGDYLAEMRDWGERIDKWTGARGQWGVDFTIRFIRPFIMPQTGEDDSASPYMP